MRILPPLDNHLRNHEFLHAGEPVPSIAAGLQGLEAVPAAAAYLGLSVIEAERLLLGWCRLAKRIGMSGSDTAQYASVFRRAAAG